VPDSVLTVFRAEHEIRGDGYRRRTEIVQAALRKEKVQVIPASKTLPFFPRLSNREVSSSKPSLLHPNLGGSRGKRVRSTCCMHSPCPAVRAAEYPAASPCRVCLRRNRWADCAVFGPSL